MFSLMTTAKRTGTATVRRSTRHNSNKKKNDASSYPPQAIRVEDHQSSSDDDDEDDQDYTKGHANARKGNSKNHEHHRSISQQLRLFLLTGRTSSNSNGNGRNVLVVLFLIVISGALVLYDHHNSDNNLLNNTSIRVMIHPDRFHVLEQAGFMAKPLMVGVYFTDVSSHSFTHVVNAIRPPLNQNDYEEMVLEKRRRQHHAPHDDDDHHHHHHHDHHHSSRRVVEPMSEHEDMMKHIQEDSEDYQKQKPRLTEHPDTCKPLHEWQEKSFPVCNNLHEHSIMGDRMFLKRQYGSNSRRTTTSAVVKDHHDQVHQGHHHHHPQHSLRRKLLVKEQTTNVDHHLHHHHDSHHEDTQQPAPQYQLLAHGYWRDTWSMATTTTTGKEEEEEEDSNKNNDNGNTFAMKTMRYEHDVTEYILDKQRRDALTSDRLGKSSQQTTVQMYAYCGTSALYEYAPGGDLYQFLERFDTAEEWLEYFSSEQRFGLAYNVTRALADLHSTEGPEQPFASIVHGDFNANQFVALDSSTRTIDKSGTSSTVDHKMPQFKLGDFNLARFVYWNQKDNHPCVIRPESKGGVFRAPEEYDRHHTAKNGPRTEKVDIYSLGNLLYTIVTGHWPFDDMEEAGVLPKTNPKHDHHHFGDDRDDINEHETVFSKLKELVQAGRRPHVDDSILKSNDKYVHAMVHAMYMCWKQDPNERATAAQVEAYLAEHLPQQQRQRKLDSHHHHHHGGGDHHEVAGHPHHHHTHQHQHHRGLR